MSKETRDIKMWNMMVDGFTGEQIGVAVGLTTDSVSRNLTRIMAQKKYKPSVHMRPSTAQTRIAGMKPALSSFQPKQAFSDNETHYGHIPNDIRNHSNYRPDSFYDLIISVEVEQVPHELKESA